uniref:Uncharacterized protein n=1 Tax=Vespula pensylvanica TaxID=30213 RepID=A0A834K1B2_VESPE|nr:hypothetical protein H0235_016235 [Vespula pensylvanica]
MVAMLAVAISMLVEQTSYQSREEEEEEEEEEEVEEEDEEEDEDQKNEEDEEDLDTRASYLECYFKGDTKASNCGIDKKNK